MGQNFKSYAVERQHMTARDVVENLADQVPGRSIGEFYVTRAWVNNKAEFELEIDDGCRFTFTCRKSK